MVLCGSLLACTTAEGEEGKGGKAKKKKKRKQQQQDKREGDSATTLHAGQVIRYCQVSGNGRILQHLI